MSNFWILGDLLEIFFHPFILLVAAAGASWVMLLRPKLKIIPLGILAFFAAAVIEFFFLPIGIFWELVLGAPVIEEILKFLANRSRTLRGGIASGLGFSIMENASYFISLASSPFFLMTVIIRSFSDVMLHSFNSGLSSFSYRRQGKSRFALLGSMAIHAAFNLGTFQLESNTLYLEVFLVAVFILMVIGILLLTKLRALQLVRSAQISAEISLKNQA